MHRIFHPRIAAPLIPFLILTGIRPGVAQTSTPVAQQMARATTSDSADRALIMALTRADGDEVAMARAVLPTLRDAELKRFAQRMIDDHGAHLTATTAIATRLKYSVAPATTPAPSSGVTDVQFINAQVTGHQQVLGQLPNDPSTIQDAGLKQHVVETKEVVQMHLEDAKRIQARLTTRTP
jgi:putative membrane protein